MDLSRKVTAELKAALLSEGVNFDLDLFKQITQPFYDNQFVYGKTSAHVTPTHKFPQVLQLGDGVITALLRRENSSWNLKIKDEQVQLYRNKDFVRTIGLPERPAYFDRTLKDGTRSESIIAVAGEDTPGFFFYPECYYFVEGKPCGFCSIKSTRKTVGKDMVSEFTEENIVESTQLFQRTQWRDIPLISITMGTCKTDDETREKVINPIKWMYEALNPKIPIHILAHPPNDFGLIEEFKDAGVTSIAFNLEVYNQTGFQNICPGKADLYGYQRWEESLIRARDIFGDYNAFCGLVWGLESPESTIEGHKYFLDKGIGLASNVFHADPRSVLRNLEQPSTEQILQISREQANLYKQYPDARTFFSVSMRSTLDWEIHRGDLE